MKNLTKIILYSLGFMVLIYIFNTVADIYNMSIFHRVISIFSISGSITLSVPLHFLLKEEFKK